MEKNDTFCDLCREQKKQKTLSTIIVIAEEAGESHREGNMVVTTQNYKNVKDVNVSICKECLFNQVKLKTKSGIRFYMICFIVLFALIILAIVVNAPGDLIAFLVFGDIIFLLAAYIWRQLMKKANRIIQNDRIELMWKGIYAFFFFIPFFKNTALLKICGEYDSHLQKQIWNLRPTGEMIPKKWRYIMAFTKERWDAMVQGGHIKKIS